MRKAVSEGNHGKRWHKSGSAQPLNRKLVLGFLLSYLVVLVLPAVSGCILYAMATRAMQNQADRANLIRLHDTESIASQQISTMISFVDRMAMNQDISSLGTMSTRRQNSTDILRIKESAEAVRRYNNTNPLITEYYIHYNRSDITLSSSDAFLDFSRFYGSYFQWGDMTQEEWNRFASEARHDRRLYPARETLLKSGPTAKVGKSLLYIQSLPLEYRSRVDGYLAVLIDEKELQRLLSGVELGDAGQSIVFNASQEVLSGVYAERAPKDLLQSLPALPDTTDGHLMFPFEGNRYSITFVRSASYGWTYLSAVPTSFVYGQMWQLGIVVAGGFLVTLLGGFALAFWLSKRNARPWQEIAQAIGAPERKDSLHLMGDSDQIRGKVLLMVEKNRDLAQVLETQRPVVQAVFLLRLLSGKFLTRQQLDRDMHLAGIHLEASAFMVLILGLERKASASEEFVHRRTLLRFLFQEKTREHFGLTVQVSEDLADGGIVFLLPLPIGDTALFLSDFRLQLQDWHDEWREEHHLFLKTACGQLCTDIMDVHRSFDEARLALAYAGYESPYWHSDLPKAQKPYFFPFEFEDQILHQVWAGNREAVDALFERLREENLEQLKLSPMLSSLLASEICGTLIHLLDRSAYDVPMLLQNIQEMTARELPEVLDCAQLICVSMAEKSQECQQKKEDELNDAIVAYVRGQHANPCFCLSDVREKFPLSVNAINALFVEKTGKTFCNYLEAYRMEMACEYLKKGTITVQEVSDSVGYSSSHSFRRAFKRRYNILPTEYQGLES